MYKMIGSGVLDKEEDAGHASHMNQEEFPPVYGIHSMSKKERAFDQVDIDGGGGNYSALTPRTGELLHGAGYPEQASGLTLWWGDRVPYWAIRL